MTDIEKLEQAKERLALLTERSTRAKVRLENETEALGLARAEARTLFGTDNPEELRALLARTVAENQQKLDQFSADLQKAEQSLREVESALADAVKVA